MTYKDTLFFIGKTLTINHITKNKVLVESLLQNNQIDWDEVVKVSTSHYVFPAIYCNLKKFDFLKYLPNDLVNYMEHITELNRVRNDKIIKQAKEINNLLKGKDVTPIFLKGTGNLLEGLYDDIGERMVGDIDFIVSHNDYRKTIKILEEDGYSIIEENVPYFHRHYPPMGKKNYIAAIEIHRELLIEKYRPKFNFNHVKDATIEVLNSSMLTYVKQFHYICLCLQINECGMVYKNISVRKAYDLFLLSQKININNYLTGLNYFKTEINCLIASLNKLLHSNLYYSKNKETENYVKSYIKQLDSSKTKRTYQHNYRKNVLSFKYKMNLLFKIYHHKDYRSWLYKKIKEKYS